MKHVSDFDSGIQHAINDDIVGVGHKLSRSRHPAGPIEIWVPGERQNHRFNPILDCLRGGNIKKGYITDQLFKIVKCRGTPTDGQH